MKQHVKKSRAIAVFGYYGVGNLGDEAVVSTLIRNIRARKAGVAIVGISLNPDDTRRRHAIDALPIRRIFMPPSRHGAAGRVEGMLRRTIDLAVKLREEARFSLASLAALRSIEMVIVAGSGGVYDWWHGAWTHPFTHFRWALLCLLTHTSMAYVSVGAGPFKTRMGKLFFRFALAHAGYRSFRDEQSIAWMDRIGMRKPSLLFPDMAFDIAPAATNDRTRDPQRAEMRRIGINAIPFYHADWSALLEETAGIGYEAYIDAVAEFASWLVERGCTPVFFHSQIGDTFLDADIAARIDSKRGGDAWRTRAEFREPKTPDELREVISGLDIVVASRFHAVLFSYLMRKPVLGISYHHKIDDLMEKMGHPANALDIRTLSYEDLRQAYLRLEHEAARGAWSVDERLFVRYRLALQQQFDALLADPVS